MDYHEKVLLIYLKRHREGGVQLTAFMRSVHIFNDLKILIR